MIQESIRQGAERLNLALSGEQVEAVLSELLANEGVETGPEPPPHYPEPEPPPTLADLYHRSSPYAVEQQAMDDSLEDLENYEVDHPEPETSWYCSVPPNSLTPTNRPSADFTAAVSV